MEHTYLCPSGKNFSLHPSLLDFPLSLFFQFPFVRSKLCVGFMPLLWVLLVFTATALFPDICLGDFQELCSPLIKFR